MSFQQQARRRQRFNPFTRFAHADSRNENEPPLYRRWIEWLDLYLPHSEYDLSYAASLRQCLRLARIAKRHPATDWQYKFPVSDVIGKLADFRGIGTREHPGDSDRRIQLGYLVWEHRGIAEVPTILHSAKYFRGRFAPNGICNAVHH